MKGLEEIELSNLVAVLPNIESDDLALSYEEQICKKISEKEVLLLAPLFQSDNREMNLTGIRILSESGRVGLERIYKYVDLLFNKNDLILTRLCVSLILDHCFVSRASNARMAEFIDSDDEPLNRSIRVWLIWRSIAEIEEFIAVYGPFESKTNALLEIILRFKNNEIVLEEFLNDIEEIDAVAFGEYTRLSKLRIKRLRAIFPS